MFRFKTPFFMWKGQQKVIQIKNKRINKRKNKYSFLPDILFPIVLNCKKKKYIYNSNNLPSWLYNKRKTLL